VIRTEVAILGAAVRHEASGLDLTEIAANVPISWGGGKDNLDSRPGSFTVGTVSVGRDRFRPISGALKMANGAVDFSATWPVVEGATLTAAGHLEPGDGGWSGDVKASLPRFRLTDKSTLASMVTAARGFTLDGTFEADAELKLRDGQLDPRVTVSAIDASFAAAEWAVTVEGVNGTVVVDSFAPLSTPGAQAVAVKRASVGEFVFADGSTHFRLEKDGSVLVEDMQWGWAGGTLYGQSFRLDPASAEKLDVIVFADNLSLGELLSLFAEGKVSGDGRLVGRIPVRVDWPRVTFGNGFLYSLPGRPGRLQVADTQFLGDLLDRGDPRFTTDRVLAEVKQRVLGALADFQYDVFSIDLVQEADGLLVKLHTDGKGLTGEHPQELDLTVNLHGAEEALNSTLVIKRGFDQAFEAFDGSE
jgi:hypothetical protein